MVRPALILLLAVAVIFFALPAQASLVYWSGYDWQTIVTDHFRIVYHQGEENLAYRLAFLSEKMYAELSKRFHFEPRFRINLVLSDSQDSPNGAASYLPHNTIRLYAVAPDTTSSLDAYDDWLNLLLWHEMTHIFHIDSHRGVLTGARYVFGKVINFNRFNPIFRIEGFAVWHETLLSTWGGRAQSVYGDMIVRGEWMSGDFPAIDEISNWMTKWPGGNIPYILGGWFHRYVAEEYGDNVWGDLSYKHAGQVWPFLYNHNMKKETGKSLLKVYREWVDSLDLRYTALKQGLEAEGMTLSQQLTHTGNENRRPRFSADGNTIFYEEDSNSRRGRIMRIDLSTRKSKTRDVTDATGDVAYFDDGTMVYSRMFPVHAISPYYDLYRLEPGGHYGHRLTQELRAKDVAAHPTERKVLAIRNALQQPTVAWVDIDTGDVTDIYTPDIPGVYLQFGDPSFSPDGSKVALSVWHNDGNRDIFLFDPETLEFRRLTFDAQRDINPRFSPDGRYILFSSGRTGIFNLYALNLKDEKLYRITNVLGGAFDPAVSPDQQWIAFSNYGPKGFDIHRMPYAPETWAEVPYEPLVDRGFGPSHFQKSIQAEADALKKELEPKDYSAIYSIWPTYWYPALSLFFWNNLSSFGVRTAANDSLQNHFYSISARYNWTNDFFSYGASYTNAIFKPIFTLSGARYSVLYGNVIYEGNGKFDSYWEERNSGLLTVAYPIHAYHTASLQYSIEDRGAMFPDELNKSDRLLIEDGLFAAVRARYILNYAQSYRRSISAAWGGHGSLSYTAYDPAFGSDYAIRQTLGQYYHYFGLPFNHVIALRATGGYAEGERLYLRSFRIGGFAIDDVVPGISENRIMLRGYNSSAQRGERVAAASMEYRLPLWYIERGLWTWPIFFNDISLSAYGDAGSAWTDWYDPETNEILYGAGGELDFRFTIAYYFTVRMGLTVAYGFVDPDLLGGLHMAYGFVGSF